MLAMLSALTMLAMVFDWPPPARYDYPYKGKLTVHWLYNQDLAAACGIDAYACAQPSGTYNGKYWSHCTIWMPKNETKRNKRALMRHEIGHCNGWPGNHPK